jgi:hypothetical protein
MDRDPPGGTRTVRPRSSRPAPEIPTRRAAPSRPVDDPPVPDTIEEGEDPVVRELEKILAEVRRWRGEREDESSAAHPLPAKWSEAHPPRAASRELPGRGALPTGYLEDHLTEARLSVADMDDEIAQLATSAEYLRHRVSLVGSDLDRITREYLITRDRESRPEEPPVPAVGHRERPPIGRRAVVRTDPPLTVPPSHSTAADRVGQAHAVYEAFTLERYNQTVGAMTSRKGKLIVLTLLLSALIGSVLTIVVLYSPSANPPLWVAVLPLVWVVPIPFFLLSLRATHRVLDQTDLRLPGVE